MRIKFQVEIGPLFSHEATGNSIFHEDLMRFFHPEYESASQKNLMRSSWPHEEKVGKFPGEK